MSTKTWLAVILSCMVLFIYTKLVPPVPKSAPVETTTISGKRKSYCAGPYENCECAIYGPFSTQIPVNESVMFANENFEAAFSDVGGKLSSIKLKKYRETAHKDSPPIVLLSTETQSQSLATLFSETSLLDIANGKYTSTSPDKNVQIFKFRSQSGVEVEKRYQFEDNSSFLNWTVNLKFPSDAKKEWGTMVVPIGGVPPHYEATQPLHAFEVVALQNDSITRKTVDSVDEGEKVLQGNSQWIAYGNKYFSSAVVNESTINPDIVLRREAAFTGAYFRYPLVLKTGEKELQFKFRTYIGPKDPAQLSKASGLKQLIDYGMFSVVAYPLLETLHFFYGFTKNYGIAIILLTILVRLLFYPLSVKSYNSMKHMQKLQPQIQALKEKYKDDKETFSREQLALFKTHKVNPAGGCLPMFIQLPVFIALYAVLGNSIDLFQAPFFGWIQDLSSKDPYYVFPVLMGISMFVQQKITPAVGMDPAQQKIMLIMPVMFSFFMINLPSGLTVYMFVSTLLGIAQQWFMMRDSKKGVVAEPAKV